MQWFFSRVPEYFTRHMYLVLAHHLYSRGRPRCCRNLDDDEVSRLV